MSRTSYLISPLAAHVIHSLFLAAFQGARVIPVSLNTARDRVFSELQTSLLEEHSQAMETLSCGGLPDYLAGTTANIEEILQVCRVLGVDLKLEEFNEGSLGAVLGLKMQETWTAAGELSSRVINQLSRKTALFAGAENLLVEDTRMFRLKTKSGFQFTVVPQVDRLINSDQHPMKFARQLWELIQRGQKTTEDGHGVEIPFLDLTHLDSGQWLEGLVYSRGLDNRGIRQYRCHAGLGLTHEFLSVNVVAAAELARTSALKWTVLDQPFGLAVYREGAHLPAMVGYSTFDSWHDPVLKGASNVLPGGNKTLQSSSTARSALTRGG